VPASDGAARAWLHSRTEIIDEQAGDGGLMIVARLSMKTQGQFFKQFPSARNATPVGKKRKQA